MACVLEVGCLTVSPYTSPRVRRSDGHQEGRRGGRDCPGGAGRHPLDPPGKPLLQIYRFRSDSSRLILKAGAETILSTASEAASKPSFSIIFAALRTIET